MLMVISPLGPPQSSAGGRVPPSRFRVPLTLLLGVTVPPLALLAWIALSGSGRTEYLQSRWVRAGFAVCVISALPLLIVAAASWLGLWPDPDPNPIGLGLLLAAGGSLGTLLVGVGVATVSMR